MARQHPRDIPPVPTLAELIASDHPGWVQVHCQGQGFCSHSKPVTLQSLMDRFGPDVTVLDIAPRMKCEACGRRGAAFHIPGPEQIARGFPG